MYLLVCMNVCCYGDVLFYSIIYIIYTILYYPIQLQQRNIKQKTYIETEWIVQRNRTTKNWTVHTADNDNGTISYKGKIHGGISACGLEEHPGGGGEGGHDDDNPGDTDADGGATGCAPIHLIIGRIPIMRMRIRHVHIVRRH